MTEVKIGGRYRHYKGKEYVVLGVVRHSESLDEHVLYDCDYDNPLGKTWVRPLKMFCQEIEVDGKLQPRFAFVR
jgi:hypothetical protein